MKLSTKPTEQSVQAVKFEAADKELPLEQIAREVLRISRN
jgi:hypothetical protein